MPTSPKLPLKLHERLGDEAMTELSTLFGDVHREIADLKREIAEVKQMIADLKAQITGVQAELIKWTFLFWLGTIGIVLLLIRFPR